MPTKPLKNTLKKVTVPPHAWGEGCRVDWKTGSLYGADGKVYTNIRISLPPAPKTDKTP